LVEGTPFGRYRLIELLGRGGMGEVWRAYDSAIDRVVALKMLLPHFAQDPAYEKRFRREARAAARLDDPHVVPIHDVGEIDGRLYVTMRLIDGVDLQTLLDAGPLEADRAVSIIEQVASALNNAHQSGLVHRDVKPSNILLGHNDFAYLIDFGIARAADDTGLTSEGAAIGTWAYMAPERFSTGESEPSGDIYALACVLYQCLTGEPPFPGSALEQIAVGHMVTPPPKPSESRDTVPEALDDVVSTGLAKQPTDRYPSSVAMAAAARQAITDPSIARKVAPTDPTLAKPQPASSAVLATSATQSEAPEVSTAPTTPVQVPLWRRRPGILVVAFVAVALLVAGGVFAGIRLTNKNPAASAPTPAVPPLAGTYTADYGAPTNMNGKPMPGQISTSASWAVRSSCGAAGCVATASRVSGGGMAVTKLDFDQIDGRWVAVGLGSEQCRNVSVEVWNVITLQPHPDGSLTGEYSALSSNGCSAQGTVTFSRTGNVDASSAPDPATLSPRVASPAETLHGRYHLTRTYMNGQGQDQFDYAVTTDCLRTGDRCMSFFHSPSDSRPLVFGNGKWLYDMQIDAQCPAGGPTHLTSTAEYPLPQPPQNPISVLTGHGHQEQTGSCAVVEDIEDTFTRTGD
jgi:serine/threonine-protein kinase